MITPGVTSSMFNYTGRNGLIAQLMALEHRIYRLQFVATISRTNRTCHRLQCLAIPPMLSYFPVIETAAAGTNVLMMKSKVSTQWSPCPRGASIVT
ncbi:hypothetical protein T265_05117 [Opisthorchis viverrini]|uniref:Uncharacterized protein n=1 Tax=Opisthorchis viverrini TaxID=6198 RepID=A0A074ZLE4_OPIVI|nr:hypothetical protein T265_05117 [Opisthorchis viverrini]KER27911.1 hypothetical protein T265_05117 [Opisthorchis viverrini]